ncbi:MAG: M23 family metallopeptidase, partial [Phormidesmis sp.]
SKCGQATGDFQSPTVGYKPHSPFNPNGSGGRRVHKGVDVGGNFGDPIFAADGGIVSVEDHGDTSWGLHVIIDHGNFKTLYGHISKVLVRTGDTVSKGDKIGKIGSSGHSNGPHLHFEVIGPDGVRIDPDSVIDWDY